MPLLPLALHLAVKQHDSFSFGLQHRSLGQRQTLTDSAALSRTVFITNWRFMCTRRTRQHFLQNKCLCTRLQKHDRDKITLI